jgi:hypothetical protein
VFEQDTAKIEAAVHKEEQLTITMESLGKKITQDVGLLRTDQEEIAASNTKLHQEMEQLKGVIFSLERKIEEQEIEKQEFIALIAEAKKVTEQLKAPRSHEPMR